MPRPSLAGMLLTVVAALSSTQSASAQTTNTDGTVDTCRENDLCYWPPGHRLRAVKDSEVILFSPQREHAQVLDHMLNAMKG